MMMNLLAVDWKTLGENAMNFFVHFSLLYAMEILMFFALIFFVSKMLRDNDATKLMVIYWLMIVAGGCLHVFESEIVSRQFFLFYVLIVSAGMLILFSVEVKKYFWDVHSTPEKTAEKKSSGGGAEVVSQAETERCMANIVKALQNMSKNNVGALIVLSKGSLPKQVLQSGVEIDAEISTQLIEGIFFPKAPLHDGAMVIHGHKIQAAGCFLPLTQKTSYPKEYGTRHRAALGVTETTDAITLIVSEETGIISMARNGRLTRHLDRQALEELLASLYQQKETSLLQSLMEKTKRRKGGAA